MAELVGIYAASHGPMIVRKWNALSLPSEGNDFVWDRRVAYHQHVQQNLRDVFTEIMGKAQ